MNNFYMHVLSLQGSGTSEITEVRKREITLYYHC